MSHPLRWAACISLGLGLFTAIRAAEPLPSKRAGDLHRLESDLVPDLTLESGDTVLSRQPPGLQSRSHSSSQHLPEAYLAASPLPVAPRDASADAAVRTVLELIQRPGESVIAGTLFEADVDEALTIDASKRLVAEFLQSLAAAPATAAAAIPNLEPPAVEWPEPGFSRISSLRRAAVQLNEAAAQLEQNDLFDEADLVLQLASELRLEARRLRREAHQRGYQDPTGPIRPDPPLADPAVWRFFQQLMAASATLDARQRD